MTPNQNNTITSNNVHPTETISTTFNRIRDIVTFISIFSYAIGIISWQYFSFRNGLGFSPNLSFQYFTSGAICFLISSIFVAISIPYYSISNAIAFESQKIFQKSFRKKIWKFLIIVIIIAISFMISYYSIAYFFIYTNKYINIIDISRPFYYSVAISISVILFYAIVIIFHITEDAKKAIDIFPKLSRILIIPFVAACGVYVVSIYPSIPQEFGGGKPSICYIDFDISKTSYDTVNELIYKEFSAKVYNFVQKKYKLKKWPKREDLKLPGNDYGKYTVSDEDIDKLKKEYYREIIKNRTMSTKQNSQISHSDEMDMWIDSSEYIILRKKGRTYDPNVNIIRLHKSMFLSMTIHKNGRVGN